MAQKCSCGNQSNGRIGMLTLCFDCVAKIFGWERKDRRLRGVVLIDLHNGSKQMAPATWIPWAALQKRGK